MPDVVIVEIDGRRCYQARLSRDGLRVMCGHPNCGELAKIRQSPKDPTYREATLPPGWAQDRDGIFRLSPHAQKSVKRGRGYRYRRPYIMADEVIKGRQVNPRPTQPGIFVKDGWLIACPRCRHISVIDFAVLRLTTDDEKLAKLTP